jgi:hypothetical protein
LFPLAFNLIAIQASPSFRILPVQSEARTRFSTPAASERAVQERSRKPTVRDHLTGSGRGETPIAADIDMDSHRGWQRALTSHREN